MSSIKNISLYIPHIFANFDKDYVTQVFQDYNIGQVNCIDFVSKMGQDGKPFNAAYIHFDHWYDNKDAVKFQKRVLNPENDAHLIYEAPWYWIVLENKARKFVPGDRKPCLDLGDIKPEQLLSKPVPSKPVPSKPVSVIVPQQVKKVKTFAEQFTLTQQEIDEIDALIDEDDKYLVCVDSRYVQSVEAENAFLRTQLAYYTNALFVEQIKSQTLAEAIGKTKKD
jgi:hypothetical protein